MAQDRSADAARLLRKCSLFRDLDEADCALLASHAHRRSVTAGQPIFHAGAPGESMMGILVGEVRIGVSLRNGKDMILSDMKPGEIFGEIALLDGRGRSADATALTNCELIVLERRDILPFLTQRPQLLLDLLAITCAKLRVADERATDIAFLEISARLAKSLLDRAPAREGQAVSRLSLSQTELARMIGCTRENVNRHLREWKRRGIVDLRAGWIVVLKRPDLMNLAAGGG